MILNFQRLRADAVCPKRATQYSAGVDLCACIDTPITLQPQEITKIPTGFAVSPSDKNVALFIFARSGLATKYGIALANGVGVVDADYRGELCVALINQGNDAFTIENGMRIAQLVAIPICYPSCNLVSILDDTQRGTDGFGSTGL